MNVEGLCKRVRKCLALDCSLSCGAGERRGSCVEEEPNCRLEFAQLEDVNMSALGQSV